MGRLDGDREGPGKVFTGVSMQVEGHAIGDGADGGEADGFGHEHQRAAVMIQSRARGMQVRRIMGRDAQAAHGRRAKFANEFVDDILEENVTGEGTYEEAEALRASRGPDHFSFRSNAGGGDAQHSAAVKIQSRVRGVQTRARAGGAAAGGVGETCPPRRGAGVRFGGVGVEEEEERDEREREEEEEEEEDVPIGGGFAAKLGIGREGVALVKASPRPAEKASGGGGGAGGVAFQDDEAEPDSDRNWGGRRVPGGVSFGGQEHGSAEAAPLRGGLHLSLPAKRIAEIIAKQDVE